MIAATKMHIPYERHTLVARTDLLRLLDEGMDAKLTLLFAPSGYGKTTALSEWAKQSGKLSHGCRWASRTMIGLHSGTS